MTRPAITFTPLYENAGPEGMHIARIGGVEVGRVMGSGKSAQWLCYLHARGCITSGWKPAKTNLAARNGLLAEVRDWLRLAGLQQIEEANHD